MRKICLVLCLLSTTSIHASSAKDAVDALRDSIGHSQLVLRNFSGESDIHAAWSGTGFQLDPPRWRTFGVLTVDSMKLKKGTLILRCTRYVAVREKTGKVILSGQPDKVDIEIDLANADPNEALPKLRDALFYASTDEALAAIPKDLQDVVPAQLDEHLGRHSSVKSSKLLCDCADRGKPQCDAEHRPADGMTPPKYLGGHDPSFSDQARRAKLNGIVVVSLEVDENGHPTDVWVARPVGMGLDEAAAQSVLTYVFQPATCHNKPVKVFLRVEVNFQIH